MKRHKRRAPMNQRVLVIINPVSGHRAMRRWKALAAGFDSQGFRFDEVVTSGPGDALRIAQARAGDYEVVVAAGGDGTVFEVINGIVAAGTARPALGLVPLGTGNDIARAAGIRDLRHAGQAVAHGRLKPIDLIQVDCQVNGAAVVRQAMLFASVGITSELLARATPRLKRICGQRLAYVVGLLFALRRYRAPRMTIKCDGESRRDRFVFACASNGETFGGGMRIAPGALLDDGNLNVNLVREMGRWEALRNLPKLLTGRHTSHPKVVYKTALDIRIETETPIEVAADGDLIGFTPARFHVRPRSLEVLVP